MCKGKAELSANKSTCSLLRKQVWLPEEAKSTSTSFKAGGNQREGEMTT